MGMQAEQALTNVAHHLVALQQDVAQQRGVLRTAQRQQQIEAALASQTPKLLQWQSIHVRHADGWSAVSMQQTHLVWHLRKKLPSSGSHAA